MPLTDRVDYLANLINNLVLRAGGRKTAGMTGDAAEPRRWMRVMLAELHAHQQPLVWLGTHALDIGAMTVFFYCFREREDILRIFEMFSGQRMMTSYIRIGGLALEPPRGWQQGGSQVHRRVSRQGGRVRRPARPRTRSGCAAPQGVGFISLDDCSIGASPAR